MFRLVSKYKSGWFQPLWKILVSWDDSSQYIYIWKKNCSKPPTRNHTLSNCYVKKIDFAENPWCLLMSFFYKKVNFYGVVKMTIDLGMESPIYFDHKQHFSADEHNFSAITTMNSIVLEEQKLWFVHDWGNYIQTLVLHHYFLIKINCRKIGYPWISPDSYQDITKISLFTWLIPIFFG